MAWEPEGTNHWLGGLNVQAAPHLLRPEELLQAENVVLDDYGRIRPRLGTQRINQSQVAATGVTGLYIAAFTKSALAGGNEAARRWLMAIGPNVYVSANEGLTWALLFASGASGTPWWTFAMLNDTVFMANGKQKVWQWNGVAAAAQIATAPVAQFIVLQGRGDQIRLFAADKTTVWWSDMGGLTWDTGSNWVEIRPDDGTLITGLDVGQGNVYVWKEDSIHGLFGANPYEMDQRTITDDAGNVCPFSLAMGENLWYFRGRRGIYAFDGARIELLSQKVEPIVTRMAIDTEPRQKQVCGAYVRNFYRIFYPDPTKAGYPANNAWLEWDVVRRCWTWHTGPQPQSLVVDTGKNGTGALYGGRYSTGNVDKFDVGLFDSDGSFAGVVILWRAETKAWGGGSDVYRKTFRRVATLARCPSGAETVEQRIRTWGTGVQGVARTLAFVDELKAFEAPLAGVHAQYLSVEWRNILTPSGRSEIHAVELGSAVRRARHVKV